MTAPANIQPEQRISNAVDVLLGYGSIDGDHHKMWVIDQAVRALFGGQPLGDEGAPFHKSEEYLATIAEWQTDEDGDEEAYEWDEGIAP